MLGLGEESASQNAVRKPPLHRPSHSKDPTQTQNGDSDAYMHANRRSNYSSNNGSSMPSAHTSTVDAKRTEDLAGNNDSLSVNSPNMKGKHVEGHVLRKRPSCLLPRDGVAVSKDGVHVDVKIMEEKHRLCGGAILSQH